MTQVSRHLEPMSHAEAMERAATEYDRFLEILRRLDPEEWNRPTDCPAWDVRQISLHVLAVAERSSTIARNLTTFLAARVQARRRGLPTVDVVNEREVASRDKMAPASIISAIEKAVDPAMRRRATLPKAIGRLRVSTSTGSEELRFIYDVVFTRDVWMHRIDIARATGHELRLTADHDGILVADLVADWSNRHKRPLALILGGPAGGVFTINGGGPEYHEDAVEFARFLAGRTQLSLPQAAVMF